MLLGYHPGRIRALLAQTHAAIDDLAHIDCSEPAAAAARDVIWLTRRNLADLWMPLLHQILASDAMTAWSAAPPPVASVRDEWARTAAWLTIEDSVTRAWSDERLIDAVVAQHGAVPPGDLFDDATKEIARRVASDPSFAERLLAAAGASEALALMVTTAAFGPAFTAEVGRRLLSPAASFGPLPDDHHRLAEATSAVLDQLATWPHIALELLHDPGVRDGLVFRAGLRTDAVREFVAAGLHLAVLDDATALGRSLDALIAFVPLAERTAFPPGVAQGIAASVGTHMRHLGPLLDAGAGSFLDVTGTAPLAVDGDPVTYADLESLYGRVVRDADAQVLLDIGLTDYLVERLRVVPDAATATAASAHPADLGDIIRTRLEPAVKALTLTFGDAATLEQRRIDDLLASRRRLQDRAVAVGFTLAGALPTVRPVTTVLKLAEKLRPDGTTGIDRVPEHDALVTLDGVVAREALRLVVADEQLRAAAGLDVLDDTTWRRLVAAADDPAIDFSNRGALMFQLGVDGADAVLVETFFAAATGTVDATPG